MESAVSVTLLSQQHCCGSSLSLRWGRIALTEHGALTRCPLALHRDTLYTADPGGPLTKPLAGKAQPLLQQNFCCFCEERDLTSCSSSWWIFCLFIIWTACTCPYRLSVFFEGTVYVYFSNATISALPSVCLQPLNFWNCLEIRYEDSLISHPCIDGSAHFDSFSMLFHFGTDRAITPRLAGQNSSAFWAQSLCPHGVCKS